LNRRTPPTNMQDIQAAFTLLQSQLAAADLGATLAYFAVFALLTALCLPGPALLLLLAGASMGMVWGTVLGTLASAVGATLTMLTCRYGLRTRLEQNFGDRLHTLNAGLQKDGVWYLLSLRLLPVIPFVVVNVLCGLTRMRAGTFLAVSSVGMLPGTAVYVYAGQQLGRVQSAHDVLSVPVLVALGLLGLLPLLGVALRNKALRHKIFRFRM
jgi:uncharacterized membrane protein YdjX (TVP38/TMEM64 family)